jgi:hypothetical protein
VVKSAYLERWLLYTMIMEDSEGRKGTGFAIRRMIDKSIGKTIPITNKHGHRFQDITPLTKYEDNRGYSAKYDV